MCIVVSNNDYMHINTAYIMQDLVGIPITFMYSKYVLSFISIQDTKHIQQINSQFTIKFSFIIPKETSFALYAN